MRTRPDFRPGHTGKPQDAALNGVARALVDIYGAVPEEAVPSRISELLAELEEATRTEKMRD